MFLSAAGAAGGSDPIDVDDVFSVDTWVGDSNTPTSGRNFIENGINLSNAETGGSADFTEQATSRVEVPTSSNFNFGTGDYTIEVWAWPRGYKNYANIYDHRTGSQNASTVSPIIYMDSSGYVYFYLNGNNRISSSGTALTLGAWNHIAVTRASGSTKMFINGTQRGSTYSDSNTYVQPASNFSFGGSLEQNTYNFNGHLSNLRVVKGTAVYTSNFTPSTSYSSAVSGTVLLALQGSTPFVDNSGNSVALNAVNGARASNFGFSTGDDGDGGLVWFKMREAGFGHRLVDTVRGATKKLESYNSAVEGTEAEGLKAFSKHGFTIATHANYNSLNQDMCSWTFRKQSKFFDIVTFSTTTGSSAPITVNHNLGSVPGMIIVKTTNTAGDWFVFHRSLGSTKYIDLGSTDQAQTGGTSKFHSTPTSTSFTLGGDFVQNATYVAYLFAHNNGDGEFGPDADQDIIKCGSYTGGSLPNEVTVGFEPQFLMIKNTTSSGDWMMFDTTRGINYGNDLDNVLFANLANAERTNTGYIGVTPTGFVHQGGSGDTNESAKTYVYMAIRRGPLSTPTDASQVYDQVNPQIQFNDPGFKTSFRPDFAMFKIKNSTNAWYTGARMLGISYLESNGANAKQTTSSIKWDYSPGTYGRGGWWDGINNNQAQSWMWRRAPGYFDVVHYTGTGSNRTVNHSLGVVPEMMWVKRVNTSNNWKTFHSSLGATKSMELNTNVAQETNGSALWNSTLPTSSVFTVGTASDVNGNGDSYIAFLFATVAGVSKVGTFVSDGTPTTIDCGFTSGARFVLIKKATTTFEWRVWDTIRGIVAGDDPYLFLDQTDASYTNGDWIDPHSSGFATTTAFSNGTYIFYAIA